MTGKRLIIFVIILVFSAAFRSVNVFGQAQVVPCQLSNPDQDTLRLFPERTNYRTEFLRIDEVGIRRGIGAEKLYRELETRIGDKWDPVWETRDIPYVFYEVLKGPERIGWIFGANQGWPGADNCQIMCRFDLDDRVIEFYFQKLPAAVNLRSMIKVRLNSRDFYAQFIGLTLDHFYTHESMEKFQVEDKDIRALDMIARISNPVPGEQAGFIKTLRGMKMFFVLIDDFKFNNKVKKEEVFAKTKYFIEHKNEIPLLGSNALETIREVFPRASRFTIDLISWKGKIDLVQKRMGIVFDPSQENEERVYPVYVVYEDEAYQDPFVRGIILGYVIPLNIETPRGRQMAMLSIAADGKDKGKIISFKVEDTDFSQLKGLSLVQFYTKDELTRSAIVDKKLDRISALGQLDLRGADITDAILRQARLGSVIADEFYFHNFFKQEEITGKIRDYLEKQANDKVK